MSVASPVNSYTDVDPAAYQGLVSDPGSGASYISSAYVSASDVEEAVEAPSPRAPAEATPEATPAPPVNMPIVVEDPLSELASSTATESPSVQRAQIFDMTEDDVLRIHWSTIVKRKRRE